MAASLNDSFVLGGYVDFQNRVQSALLQQCATVVGEGLSVNNHTQRMDLVHRIIGSELSLTAYTHLFAWVAGISTACVNQATANGTVTLTGSNIQTQTALVSDANIQTAVANAFNAFAPGIAA